MLQVVSEFSILFILADCDSDRTTLYYSLWLYTVLIFGNKGWPSFFKNFITILNILFIFQPDFENYMN